MNHLPLGRREFLKAAAGLLTVGTPSWALSARADSSSPERPFVGIHLAAHSLYDEGFDHCLDLLRDTTGVNALFVTSNSYYGAMLRPKEAQGDHGVPIRDGRSRRVTRIFFKPHEEFYSGSSLRHQPPDANLEYAGKEIFADLAEPARRRGMKVYERMYEPGGPEMAGVVKNWERVLTVDVHGKPASKPCWNNPEYLAWVAGSLADLFHSYPLNGIQYGAERNGPLSRLIDWPAAEPTCFCEHCRRQAEREGIDFARAQEGLMAMSRLVRSLAEGESPGPDGPLVAFLRLLVEYPEILAWERMHYRAGERLHGLVRDTVKAAQPSAHVGRHVDHAQSSWDFLFRAALPYARMAEASEFLKISTYQEILGPRLKNVLLNRYGKHILQQLPPEQLLEFYYALAGLDRTSEPSLDRLDPQGLSAEYVYRETRRAVESVAGKAAVYAGIALDVPRGSGWGSQACPSPPELVERAVHCAFDAGADGIVICREYEENRVESLKAVGRAVRALRA